MTAQPGRAAHGTAPDTPPAAEQRTLLQAAIEQFSRRIPEMVVIGGVLRRALPSDPQLQSETSGEH
jgi:hypothetical protein